MVTISEEVYLRHYGTPRRSGRYPWGSGGNESQQNKAFLDYIQDMKRQGLTDTQIANGIDMSTTDYRALRSIAKNEQKQAKIIMANRLAEKGYSNGAIAERMGLPGESSVRALRAEGVAEKADALQTTANFLKEHVDQKTYLDVGAGVENQLGISKERLATAVAVLKQQGYEVHTFNERQLGTGHDTKFKVLVPPGITQKDAWLNKDQLQQIQGYSEDNGRTFLGILPPLPVNPNRVDVRYSEDGGTQADGVIYVRPGVDDVSLGKSNYAQVRIQVGDGHYLKGMAMYKDGLPDGVDLQFNTNKSKKDVDSDLDAFKPLQRKEDGSVDQDNPFGAVISRQIGELGTNGKVEKLTSAMNLVHEEGDWAKWSKTLASQVLSKQSPVLAKEQLSMALEKRQIEFDKIKSITNPVVRKKLLQDFSEKADSAAVQLQAARLPRQAWHAILPVESLSPGQVYAPNYADGETVALIRYPHGGRFEIPELTVNNKHRESKGFLGDAVDAIGIHPSVAERLSGADFDGDTVLVIPNNSRKIQPLPALEGLKNFDPRSAYPGYPGMKVMTNKQNEMGQISNLITDMTIRKASTSEIASAVKHSMVVIDAEKHGLNYKQSYRDNGIKNLKEKYQSQPDGSRGASTLISRAKSTEYVVDRKDRTQAKGGPIDPVTGKRVYEPTGRVNYKTGAPKLKRSTKLAETDDANTLSSGTRMESIYADHSNSLKNMANQARLEVLNTPRLKYSASAKKVYANEVQSLNSQLNLALKNKPLERQAQILANAVVKAKRNDFPNMDAKQRKKIEYQALEQARLRTGAKKTRIRITPTEWEAIQAGAISSSKLEQILNNADIDIVRELATPQRQLLMTSAKTRRAQSMLASGYTRSEVANHLGVSVTTLDTTISGDG